MTEIPPPPGPTLNAAFDHQPRTRLVYGVQVVARVGELARELDATKVLLVTDPGIVAAGHADRVRQALAAAGVQVTVFDRVEENPSTGCVEQCAAAARGAGIDLLVGLGGGSSMDTAKGCNFLITNGGRMRDYWGIGKARRPMLPLIAIPTTAGTGSECQSFALITDENTHEKMACGDPKAAARVAILDPALTVSQPAQVTASTGIDAIAHAVETAVTNRRTALSHLYSQASFRLTAEAFPRVLQNPADLVARGNMLFGAALAGCAIENSMLGAAHAAANPLTAQFGVIHGRAVGMLLPAVVRFNAVDAAAKQAYAELAVTGGVACLHDGLNQAVELLAARLEWLFNAAGLPRSLAEYGVTAAAIPVLAQKAASQWTAGFNPRTVTSRDFEVLYQQALNPRPEGRPARVV